MSELSNFIKAKLGRTSAKLVQSFANHLKKCDNPDWEAEYPHWIKTVTQRPLIRPKENAEITEISRDQLYKVIARQQAEIKRLQKELERNLRIKQRYQAPPISVVEALAIYGD